MSDWPTPDYDRELDGPDEAIPCPYCGADEGTPCDELCATLAPLDIPGTTIDWSDVAATSRSHEWKDMNDHE